MPIIDTGRTFEIYSIGDGLFMRRIIDSISAMNNAGVLLDLVALSMMLGLLIMAFRNVAAGGSKLDLGSTLVSLILGVTLFGMKATVVIHDMNYAPGEVDQPSYVVDNVPFGVAAAGYIISGIGYELTLKMEQGYGLYSGGRSSLIEGGFGNTLSWINQIRAWENPMFSDGGTGGAARFRENMTEYMKSCVLPGIEMGHLSLPQIMSSTNIWSEGSMTGGGIGYPSAWLSTKYRPQGGSPSVKTCEQAWYSLEAEHEVVFDAYAEALAKRSLGQTSTSGQDVATALSEAYNSIGVSTAQMQELVVAGAIGISLELALKGRDSASLEPNSKLMIEQASMQRAVQWAAEETMFRRIMRPMMAFFESLMYALAPFMALAIGLGSYGIQTIGKYLMLSIWVALWMPVLSIIELYQVTMMQHAVNAMMHGLDGHTTVTGISIAGSNELRTQAIEWLSTGAAMAAFTPAITMALVWGGAITASSLASQIRGGDTVNEKISAPDAVNPGAATSVAPRAENTAALGTQKSGSSGMNPKMMQGSDLSALQASAFREYASTQATLGAIRSQVAKEMFGDATGVAAASGRSSQGGVTGTEFGTAGRTEQVAGSDQKQHGTNVATQDSNILGAVDGWKVSLAAGGDGGLPGGGLSHGSTSTETSGTTSARSTAVGAGVLKSDTAAIANGTDFRTSRGSTETQGLTATQQKQLQKALENNKNYERALRAADGAERAFQAVSALKNSYGSQQSVDISAVAQQISENNPGMAANISSLVSQAGYTPDQVNSNLPRVFANSGSDRMLAAQLLTLQEGAMRGTSAGVDQETASFRKEAYANAVMGTAVGKAAVESGAISPDAYKGVGGVQPTREELDKETAAAIGPGFVADALRREVQAATRGDPRALGAMTGTVNGIVDTNPGGYGPAVPFENMTPAAAAETTGRPVMDAVKKKANEGVLDAATGFGASAFNEYIDGSTTTAVNRMVAAAAFTSEMPEGSAGEGHPLTAMIRGYQQSAPWLSPGQQEALAVNDYINQYGTEDTPRDNYNRAMATYRTAEGRAAIETYGSPSGGKAALAESSIRVENGERPIHEGRVKEFEVPEKARNDGADEMNKRLLGSHVSGLR